MNKIWCRRYSYVLPIFLSWLLVNYLSNEPYRLPSNKDLVIPFIWSCMFIYLHGKNYFYIAINSYVIFLLMIFADRLNFGAIPGIIQISYLFLSLFSAFTFVFFYQYLFAKKSHVAFVFSFIVTIVLYTVPIFYIIYAINFNTVISEDVFFAAFQTNVKESVEFSTSYISPIWIGVVLLLSLFAGYLLLMQEKKETFYIEKSLLIFMIVTFSTLSFVNKDNIRLYSFAKSALTEYGEELTLFRQEQKKLKNNDIQFEAKKTETGETYLVVIGESLNKKNMGIYGYMRETTPLLKRMIENDELLVFDNAFSCHTHTMPVLSLSLTEANQLNGKNYYDSLSIINILHKADIDSYWVTNQLLYGAWDNLVSLIAHQSDHLISLNKSVGKRSTTQNYDGKLISEVNNILSKDNNKNKVIFVHLMGNHGDYCSRYPDEYRKFNEKLKVSEFGKLSTVNNIARRINCYDNSVLYNDYVVSSLLKSLQKLDSIAAFLYFSDHADDVIGQLGHNSGNFTYHMTQIPLTVWLSEKYKNRYQDKYNILLSHKNVLYPNDFIYDTLIGMFIYKD